MVSVFFGKVFLFSIPVFFAFSTCGDDPKASTVPGECPHQAGPYGNEKTVTRSGQKIFLEIPIEGMLLYVYLIYIYIYTYDFDFLHLTGFLIGPFSTRRWNLHFPPGHCRSQGQGAVWSSKHLAWYAEFLGAARPQRTLRKIDVGLRKPAVWKMHFSNWMWPLNPWLFFGGSSWNLGFVFFCWWMKRCWLLEVWRYAFFWWNGIVCWVWKALSPLF